MRKVLLITTIIAGVSTLYSFPLLAQKAKSPDVIVQWNLTTVKATKIAKQNSNLATRTEAIEAIAVYDAVNAIKHIGKPYHYAIAAAGPASPQAAVAQAAHDVLVTYFPEQKASIDSALNNSLQAITEDHKEAGEKIGSASAADIIASRANDGSSPLTTYAGPEKPVAGAYRPTPGKFVPGIDVEWGNVKPFLLHDSKQFLPEPPPALGSDEYKKALNEVAEIGEIKSTKRTDDQTHIAQFYKQDAELTVNEGLRLLAVSHGTSLEQNALIFALTDIAEAD